MLKSFTRLSYLVKENHLEREIVDMNGSRDREFFRQKINQLTDTFL